MADFEALVTAKLGSVGNLRADIENALKSQPVVLNSFSVDASSIRKQIEKELNRPFEVKINASSIAREAANAGKQVASEFATGLNGINLRPKGASSPNVRDFLAGLGLDEGAIERATKSVEEDFKRFNLRITKISNSFSQRSTKDGTLLARDGIKIQGYDELNNLIELTKKFNESGVEISSGSRIVQSFEKQAEAARAASQEFEKLKELQASIGQKKVTLAGLDPQKNAAQFSELSKQLATAETEYDKLFSKIKDSLSDDQKNYLSDMAEKAALKISEVKAKVSDKFNAEVNNTLGKEGSFTEATSVLNSIFRASSELTSKGAELKEAFRILNDAGSSQQDKETAIERINKELPSFIKNVNAAKKAQDDYYKEATRKAEKDTAKFNADSKKALGKEDSFNDSLEILDRIKNASDELIRKRGDLKEAFSILNDTTSDRATKQLAIERINKELPSFIKNVKKAAEAEDTLVKSRTVANKAEKWLNDNPDAANVYGDRVRELIAIASTNSDPVALKNIRLALAEIFSEAGKAGLTTNKFVAEFKSITKQLLGLTSTVAVIQRGIRLIKQGVAEVTKLDDSLVDLKKTTTMSGNDLAEFYHDANEQAKRLGVTTQQIIQSAADWSRMGYGSKEDATRMAGLASQFAAISPGMSVDDATTGLVSIMKAYGIATDNVLDGVMSKINAVGNNFSTTNAEIVAGLQKSAASFAIVGGSLDENIALFTAGQEVVQNAEQVGNALRTIGMRIRGYDEETEQLSSDLVNISGTLIDLTKTASHSEGISIFKEGTNEYKQLGEYLSEIAEIIPELEPQQKQDLMEALFGKNRATVGAAILQNIDAYKRALEVMQNSAGSADKEMSIITGSISYHMNALKETWVGVSQNVFEQDDIIAFIDTLTWLSEVIQGITRLLGTKGTIIAGGGILDTIKSLKSIFSYGKENGGILTFEDFFKAAKADETGFNLIKLFSAFKKGATEAAATADASAGSIKKFFTAFGGGMKAGWETIPLLGKIGIAIAAVYAAVKVVDYFTESEKEAREKLEGLKDECSENESKLTSLNSDLETTSSRIAELQSKDKLTFVEQEELGNLQRENAELERQISLLNTILSMNNGKKNSAFVNAMDKSTIDPRTGTSEDTGGALIGAYNYWTDLIVELDDKYTDDPENKWYQWLRARYEGLRQGIVDRMLELNNEWSEISNGISYIPDPQTDDERKVNYWLDYINDFKDKLNILLGGTGAKWNAFNRVVTNSTDDGVKGLVELGKQGKVTADMLADPQYADFVDKMIQLGVITSKEPEQLGLLADAFNGTGFAAEAAAGRVDNALSNLSTSSNKTLGVINGINSAVNALNSQGTGKSISLSDFSGEISEYASALEYVNGSYQLNAEKVNEIVKARAAEQIAINNTNKALAQQKYLENAKQIEQYRRELEQTSDKYSDAGLELQRNIDRLLEENSALKDECAQYDLMNASLREATSAYQAWLNAKNAAQSGDMFDESLEAFKLIDDVLNNSTSDVFNRVGRTDYKAAVDFLVPDTVDKEDAAAVNRYLDSISDMFTYDGSGNRTGLNIGAFVQKAFAEGLLEFDEASKSYFIAAGKSMDDFATQLGLSLPLVRAMFGELEEYGAKFDWSDEAPKTMGDIAVAAYESAEALRSLDKYSDLKIVMDVSEFKDPALAVDALYSTINEMRAVKVGLSVDDPAFQYANDVIRYCISQVQILQSPAIMSVDASKVTSDVSPAIELLQRFQEVQNSIQTEIALGGDTSELQTELDGIVEEIKGLSPEILAKIGIDGESIDADSIQTYINQLDADAIIKLGIDASLVAAYEEAEHSTTGVCVWYEDTSKISTSFTATGYVRWTSANGDGFSGRGGNFVNGSANAYGTAFLNGNWAADGGKSLVGELGREIIVDPRTGRWYTVGDYGAEFVDVPDGAIIFNHIQSESLLKNGRITGRGSSYASGSAFVQGYNIPADIGGGTNKKRYGAPQSGSPSSNKDDNKKKDDDLERFDWIKIAIDRVERVIKKFGKSAESVFNSLRTRIGATNDEIGAITSEIELQEKAQKRYLSEAESVGLSSKLKQLVRDGTIDISKYDKDTIKLINEYKELYENALNCSEAIDDLRENLSELYKDNFGNIQKDFENRLSLMEKQSSTYSKKIDKLEEQGYMQNADYYRQLRSAQEQNIGVLNQELASLQNAFEIAMSAGDIEEGSEAWYEMKLAIEDTKAAIEDAEIELIKCGNSIRQIEWDYFDYAQERVEQITSEAEFLLSLIEGSNMYDDSGNFTDDGLSAAGLHAERYGVYMAQAEKYAEEIKRINKDLANDPNNTKLIKRRDELIESQRQSILSAKEEKEALVDLAKDGVNVQLEAIKELIDSYTDSLDTAKDLYDYQKKIADKTKTIASLEKQLAAYQNDNSEEARSKVQKIQSKLDEAKSSLEETEFDRLASDTGKMLDELYTEYEDTLNGRFDNIDNAFAEMIAITNDNFSDIGKHLSDIANGVGYMISDGTNSIWENGGMRNGVVSVYGDEISDKLTSTVIAVDSIFLVLKEIAKKNGVEFAGTKSYASGGLVDYTGIANVHGTSSNPELVLNADDTKNFIALRNVLRDMDIMDYMSLVRIGDGYINRNLRGNEGISNESVNGGGQTIGEINLTIPIEHIDDYNDFVNKLRSDSQFEKLVQEITIGRIAGKSSLSKNKYNW